MAEIDFDNLVDHPEEITIAPVPTIVTLNGDPQGDHLSDTGQGLDGVAKLLIPDDNGNVIGGCSGTLLWTGTHVLTAAHCLQSVAGQGEDVNQLKVVFDTPANAIELGPIQNDQFIVHPLWNRNIEDGNDMALIELPQALPASVPRYGLYRGSDEAGELGLIVGYGLPGTGTEGKQGDLDDFGVRRFGWNEMDQVTNKRMIFDFDSGKSENNSLGTHYGLGDMEVSFASGDSGGPTFVNGKVAGVHSYVQGFHGLPDASPGKANSSFGERNVDMRVSAFAGWIDAQIGVQTIDDGDAGYQSDSWPLSGLTGYQDDSRYGYGGSARYTFSNVEPGMYRIFTNTPGHSNSTHNALYTISSGSNTGQTTRDQRTGTEGWEMLDYFEVPAGATTLEVRVAQGPVGSGAVRTDAIRIEPFAPPSVMTIDDGDPNGFASSNWQTSGLKGYQGDSRYGYSGSATYTFSGVSPGWYQVSTNTPGHSNSTSNAQYTISSGGEFLHTTLDQRTGTDGWQTLDYVQIPEGSTSLVVEVSQGPLGSGAIRTDAVRIERTAEPQITTIDDGDPGFSVPSYWGESEGLKGYQGDSRWGYGGAATYDFQGVSPGQYNILVRIPGPNSYSSTKAVYKITASSQTFTTEVNQRTAPNGWRELGILDLMLDADAIQVEVSQGEGASGAVRADAIRIELLDTFFERYERDLLEYLNGVPEGSGSAHTEAAAETEANAITLLAGDLVNNLPDVVSPNSTLPSKSALRFIVPQDDSVSMKAETKPGDRCEQLVKQVHLVLSAELSGIGETEPGHDKRDYGRGRFGRDVQEIHLVYLIGRSFVGLRTVDVLRWSDYLSRYGSNENPLPIPDGDRWRWGWRLDGGGD